jgi:hypothetical protein
VWRRFSIKKEGLVLLVALSLGVYEVLYGGGRASVLTFIIALLASPVVMRIDDAREKLRRKEKPNDSGID